MLSLTPFQDFLFYNNFGAWCIRNGYGSLGEVQNTELFTSPKFCQYYAELITEEDKLNKRDDRIWNRLKSKYDAFKEFRQSQKKQ